MKQDKENGGKKEKDIRTVKKVNTTRKREGSDNESEEDDAAEVRELKILQEMMMQSQERMGRRQQTNYKLLP